MFNKTYNTYDSGVDFPDEINIHHHRPTTAEQFIWEVRMMPQELLVEGGAMRRYID